MRVCKRAWSIAGAVLLGLALWGVLFLNAAWRRSGWDLADLGHARRYWEGLTVATVRSQLGANLSFDGRAWDWQAVHVQQKLHELVPKAAQQREVRPWQFWRTVPLRRFDEIGLIRLREDEDVGRVWLTTLGFGLLGGVAPYLLLWVGVLVALPIFVWTSVECVAAGYGRVGAVFLMLCALSTYLAEQLTLPYSAAGFHVAGLLCVVPLAVYALLAPQPTWRGLVGRWTLAGLLFAICALSRGTVRSFLAAYVLLAVATAARVVGPGERQRVLRCAAAAALALGLLVAPSLPLRPPTAHHMWTGVWQGLGDFDREKGFVWDDPRWRQAMRNAGYVFQGTIQPGGSAELDVLSKRLALEAIRADPAWYLGILARRVPATLLQTRLWPRESVDGSSFDSNLSWNEGSTDLYYRLTRTADWFGLGPLCWELPLPLLWAPAALLVAAWIWRRTRVVVGWQVMAVVSAMAIAGMATPIGLSTSAGPEMQAFVIVYLLAAAFVVDAAVRWRQRGDRAVAPTAGVARTVTSTAESKR